MFQISIIANKKKKLKEIYLCNVIRWINAYELMNEQ